MYYNSVRARFDGEHICLDEPYELRTGVPLLVMIGEAQRAVPSHFNGEQVCLGEAYDLASGIPPFVTVLDPQEETEEEERAAWAEFAMQSLARAYDDDEPEYTLDMIKEWNLEYGGH
jgi:hypothetical protein